MTHYFDTSAIIKLLITEQGSDLARDLWNASDVLTTNRVGYAEARAALAAAGRSGRLDSTEQASARRGLEERFREVVVMELTAELARDAGDAADEHGLRAYDAVHLASSLALDRGSTVMVTWDRELAWAAYRSGLDIAGISID